MSDQEVEQEQFSCVPSLPFYRHQNPKEGIMAFNAWLNSVDQEISTNIADQDLSRERIYEDESFPPAYINHDTEAL